MSCAVSVRCSKGRSRPSFLFNFRRPTGERSYRLEFMNRLSKSARAVSTEGVSPGRKRNFLDPGRLELRNEPLCELGTFPYQGLFRTFFKHFRRTAQTLMDLGIKLPQHLALDDSNLLDRIIHLEQIVA